jgi:opacity protein-like surface antigen
MKILRLLTALAFASSAALVAQEEKSEPFKPYLAFGFSFAQGHAHDMTQTTWKGVGQFTGEFGVEFNLPTTTAKMRPNFGMAKLLATDPSDEYPNLYDMMGIYVGLDLVFEPFKQSVPGLTFSTGPSTHTWHVDKKNAFGDPNQHYKGMKLGWRLGAGYRINDQFDVILDFTQTEWRTIKSSDPGGTVWVPGFNPSRPAYFTLKCTYAF